MNTMYCSYFQAIVHKPDTWYLVAILRSFEHLAFDRTLDTQKGIVEFFVPQDMQNTFITLMDYFKDAGVVLNWQQLPNRLEVGGEV